MLVFFLTRLKLQKHFPEKQLKSFYISEEKTFPELDLFLKSSVAAYNLNNSVFPGERFRNIVAAFLALALTYLTLNIFRAFLALTMTHILTFKGPLKQGLGRMIAEDPSIQATVSEFLQN